jgi:hypothetical protein
MAADPAFREWWATYLRMGASPATAVALTRMNAQIDIRHILPTVRVPALVLHRTGDRCLLVEEGRYVAGLMPEARFVELPGHDHLPFVGDQDALLDEVERFLSGLSARRESMQMLATILCASCTVGHRRGFMSIEQVFGIVSAEASRFGASSVERAGDLVYAVFDGPARAIRCGCEITAAARTLGVPLHVGLHTGECDLAAGVAGGLVAEIGARVASLGHPGEVLVSRTVVDLVAGSGLRFTNRGMHRLTPELAEWGVFAVEQRAHGRLLQPHASIA